MDARERLDPAIFNLPVGRIRAGYYSDAYFNFAKQLLEDSDRHPRSLMQVFQREHSILGGIDEAIAVLKLGAGRALPDGEWEPGWERLEVRALHEGDEIEPWETVMTIEGDYTLFAHLETVYLGVLTRRTLITTNTARDGHPAMNSSNGTLRLPSIGSPISTVSPMTCLSTTKWRNPATSINTMAGTRRLRSRSSSTR